MLAIVTTLREAWHRARSLTLLEMAQAVFMAAFFGFFAFYVFAGMGGMELIYHFAGSSGFK